MGYSQASPISAPRGFASPVPAVFEDYDISELLSADAHYNDPGVELSYERAVHKLNILAGPVLLNRGGERVWFAGLDWDVQCGMVTALTRPIHDKEEFIRNMPKGRWSDYEGNTSEYRNGGSTEVDLMSGSDELDGSDDEMDMKSEPLSPNDGLGLSIATADTTSATPTAPYGTWIGWRKDSAHSPEKATAEQPQPLTCSPKRHAFSTQSTPQQNFRRPPTPHEKVTFGDDLQTTMRRVIPGIEDSWHPSKYRVSRSMEELNAEADKILLPMPRLGSIGSVWSKISLR